MIRALAITVALAACHSPDECDRAVARLARIEKTRHAASSALDECRKHTPDPVLYCAMSQPTDEAAKACIDAFLKDVLGSGGSGAPLPPEGRGLNPLLDDH